MPLRVAFMGTPRFRGPDADRAGRPGPRGRGGLHPAAAAAGRGMATRKSPVHEAAERFGLHGPHAARASNPRASGRARRPRRRRRRGRRLWADPAASRSSLPRARLPQPARLAAAALARRRPDPAGDHGRRRARPASWSCAWKRASTPARSRMAERIAIGPDATAGELHRAAGRARRRPDGARARRAVARRADLHAAGRRTASPTPGRSRRPRRGSTGRRPAAEVHNHIRGLSPDPGAWFEANFGRAPERVKVLRSTRAGRSRRARHRPRRGLAVACGEGAVRLLEVQRAGKRRSVRRRFCAARRWRRGAGWDERGVRRARVGWAKRACPRGCAMDHAGHAWARRALPTRAPALHAAL